MEEKIMQEGMQLPVEVVLPTQVLKDEKGHFVKGVSGNPAGRSKGSLSTKTKILKSFTESILTDGGEKFRNELMKLEGKEYVSAYINMLEFCVPRLARTEHSGEGETIKVTQVFKIGDVIVNL